ncbi:major facilitator superfamily domain-containing protein [Emericellopsis atlantica]|uniref:Major facilitator superfamily domain-containing protein n=1 Tax=Emericellopsis atlantica TaxID=2614577 RepID=A0A9P8CQV9_9HYPO|nr:major facilitator superfamily domain-containing protein [Emericellopsis atlantica]KAG9256063.1 major facilitator superfamily domain-containing protein [Emericellopsis atlantica]
MPPKNASPTRAKLPVQQLAILAVVRFAEPLAYTSVFPYLPEMIRDFGVEQNKIARWAGLTSAVFSVAQSITAVPWGRGADRYGRKPMIILGLLSTMLTFIVWGMSTTLPMAIVARAIQGGGNGNVGIIRTMVAEMVPERELQPRAFSVMPLVWSLGSVVGPSFGGFFAHPARQWPSLFGKMAYFRTFPYALPNLVAGIFFLISVAVASLFLRETLPGKRDERDWGISVGKRLTRAFKRRGHRSSTSSQHRRRSSFVDGEATAPLIPANVVSKKKSTTNSPPSTREVFTRETVINLVAYTFLAFHSVAYDQNLPVFLNYPKVKDVGAPVRLPFSFQGGFGLTSGEIGTIFTCYGVACGLIQFLIYPTLVSRYGVLRCFRVCSLILPVTYFLTPYTALFDSGTGRYVSLALIMFVKGFSIIIAFPSTTILLTNSCSSVRVLGTLNGFATSFSGLGRAAGPLLTGLAFTWGAENGFIFVPYAFLSFIALLGAIPVFMAVEGDGPSATPDESDAEDVLPNESAIVEEEEDSDEDERSPLLTRAR